MKKWILKAIIQKAISLLPYRHQINHLFQKYVTGGVHLSDAYLEDKLIHFQKHSIFFEGAGAGTAERNLLELGTGWYPIVPICFFLSGARRITTVDISPFLTKEKLRLSIQKMVELNAAGQLEKYFKPLPGRWDTLLSLDKGPGQNLEEILEQLHIRYLIADARALPMDANSVDLIISNNTFEHIYPEILERILQEFQRVLKSGGLMSHFIDMSDHFAHLDPSITIYNFLRFSKERWAWIDNSIQPQNRWRILHYRHLYAKLGIRIAKEENRPGDLEQLRSVPIHPDFSGIPEADLAVSHSYLLSH